MKRPTKNTKNTSTLPKNLKPELPEPPKEYTAKQAERIQVYKAKRKPGAFKIEPNPSNLSSKTDFQPIQSDPILSRVELLETTGVADVDAASHLLAQLMQAAPGQSIGTFNSAFAFLHGLNPENPLEGLIATQMVTTHNLAMEYSKRALKDNITMPMGDSYINRVSKLMRLFMAQAETLHKLRNGGKQTIQVQHVQVNEGGQAIVGTVTQGGGVIEKA